MRCMIKKYNNESSDSSLYALKTKRKNKIIILPLKIKIFQTGNVNSSVLHQILVKQQTDNALKNAKSNPLTFSFLPLPAETGSVPSTACTMPATVTGVEVDLKMLHCDRVKKIRLCAKIQ